MPESNFHENVSDARSAAIPELIPNCVLGFTGTQHDLVESQKQRITSYLLRVLPHEVHHGDCVGADEQFHAIVRETLPNARIVIHPPINNGKRAFCQGDEELEPRAYLTRNRAIVRASQMLLAAPKEEEILRSGTWSTIRFARKRNLPFFVVLPDDGT